jgi:uncharacterized protein
MTMIELTRSAARRYLVLHHLLAPPRSLPPEPESVMRVVDRLGSLQFDPLEVAGRNHDLVLLARIAGYRREWTDDLLYRERRLYETYNKMLSLVPTAELPWYRITWDRHREGHGENAFREHGDLVEELLDRMRREGPLSSTDVEPRAAIDWYWRPTNQVRAILEALAQAGVIGISRREGNRRVYDLVERLFPAALLAERRPEREQRRHKLMSRYRAHGLLGKTGQAEVFMGTTRSAAERTELREELVGDGMLVPVTVEGVKGERYLVAEHRALLDQASREIAQEQATGRPMRPGGQAPGVAFLAPLDPLAWDRGMLRSLWDYDYIWEVYVPAAKRRWGYYVLPLLWGDRLVGRIEPRIDRATKTLRVVGLWWEDGFDPLAEPGFVQALAAALAAHRDFADLSRIALPRTVRHRPLVAALRPHLEPRVALEARVAS